MRKAGHERPEAVAGLGIQAPRRATGGPARTDGPTARGNAEAGRRGTGDGDIQERDHGHDDETDPPVASDGPAGVDQLGRTGVRSRRTRRARATARSRPPGRRPGPPAALRSSRRAAGLFVPPAPTIPGSNPGSRPGSPEGRERRQPQHERDEAENPLSRGCDTPSAPRARNARSEPKPRPRPAISRRNVRLGARYGETSRSHPRPARFPCPDIPAPGQPRFRRCVMSNLSVVAAWAIGQWSPRRLAAR